MKVCLALAYLSTIDEINLGGKINGGLIMALKPRWVWVLWCHSSASKEMKEICINPQPLINENLLEISSQALQQDVPGREGVRTGRDRFSLTGSGIPDRLQVGAVVAAVAGIDLDQQIRVVGAI